MLGVIRALCKCRIGVYHSPDHGASLSACCTTGVVWVCDGCLLFASASTCTDSQLDTVRMSSSAYDCRMALTSAGTLIVIDTSALCLWDMCMTPV
jgi:hypothetical protein